MAPQVNAWTCSVCSYTWVIQATNVDRNLTRTQAEDVIGNPACVNPTYGLMSALCMIKAFEHYGLTALQKWVTFDEAYAICGSHTGVINPIGMYHVMGIRGTQGSDIWVANSARGYKGVYDALSRSQFNAYGPVQVIYLVA